MKTLERIDHYQEQEKLSSEEAALVYEFFSSHLRAASSAGLEHDGSIQVLDDYLDHIVEQIASPFQFPPYHQRVRAPFDYYSCGMEFIRPCVDREESRVLGREHLSSMMEQLERGGNVVLFGNHQSEIDPQVLSLLLEEGFPVIAEEVIFVAGNRVLRDPIAIPFSMGRNLLCIHSKRYINVPPEKREEKQRHNQRTMKLMSQLLAEGGKCIYVAPSGGRDRPGPDGQVGLAPFDASSLQMFLLMAQRAKKETHFYPLALATYDLLPPPNTVRTALGERRIIRSTPVHLNFGAELSVEDFPGHDLRNKKARRNALAQYVFDQVNQLYKEI